MKALSMYSGGCDGISVAGSWVGIDTLAYCDSEPACRAVLRGRHPQAPIFETDEDVTINALHDYGIDPGSIDIVFGGPPCQIASIAGKRLGAGDPRNRWPEFLRIVGDIRPRWIMAENVPGLLSARGKSGIKGELFGDILSALAEMGYRIGWCCYGAADVGAPHKRERLFIVGYARGAQLRHDGEDGRPPLGEVDQATDAGGAGANVADAGRVGGGSWRPEPAGFQGQSQLDGRGAQLADAESAGLPQRRGIEGITAKHAAQPERFGAAVEHAGGAGRQERNAAPVTDEQGYPARRSHEGGRAGAAQPGLDRDAHGLSAWMDGIARKLEAQRWPAGRGQAQYPWEPPRIAEGVPNRAARIRMIGNSCPPQQYLVVLAAIAEADRMMMKECDAYDLPAMRRE